MSDSKQKLFSSMNIAILVAALGYFVDVYDLILFNVVRWQSLEDLGLTMEQQAQTGVWLLNLQLIGMLVGGVLWGVLGDLRGRRSVLFGSIILYSLANFLNAVRRDRIKSTHKRKRSTGRSDTSIQKICQRIKND